MIGRWLEQKPELQEMLEADRQAAASQYLNENKLRGKPVPVLVSGEGEGGRGSVPGAIETGHSADRVVLLLVLVSQVRVEDESLASSSSAFRVLSQQVALVNEAFMITASMPKSAGPSE